ncbi:MAG: stage V sporulation protein AC [Clostridium sp.]|uniref:stage V sporulation protein AC n=1 Tax=Clostridium sp. DSM 8431 TaxID=1761781 RepID=UPI000B7EB036|nr:stage V sporulation protein AC [Clostridium sp. DSM 8431]MCR4943658.1 stage V sporulation protein AC [Clostridium sp.]
MVLTNTKYEVKRRVLEVVKDKKIQDKFQTLTKESAPKPNILLNCFRAFWVGGLICSIGQFIYNFVFSYDFTKEEACTITSISMVFLGALLTGLGIYARIAEYAGAGTVVPITGFSNAVVSPAIEFKKEGFVFGVASKMFNIAGPVLVYGIGSSVLIGIVYYIISLF